MDRVNALNDLKRSKGKCSKEFNNELDDFRRPVNDKDGLDTPEHDHKDQPVKRNLLLLVQVKVEGQKAGTSKPVPGKLYNPAHPAQQGVKAKIQTKRKLPEHDHKDQPVKRNLILLVQVKAEGQKAGTSKPVSEKLCNPAQQGVKAKIQTKRKLPEAILAGTSSPVSEKLFEKAKGHTERKLKGVEGHLSEKAGASNSVPEKPCERSRPAQQGLKAKRQKTGQKDKGKRVVTEIPEVEILDNAAFSTQGISNPFVPSNRYHESLSDENDETLAFRKDVLEVLREPFNREEYKRLYKEFIGGSYHVYYEDVKKKMHRLRQEKRWIILRGFFFWLQHVCREGAFRPWTDRACLEVEPGHVGDN